MELKVNLYFVKTHKRTYILGKRNQYKNLGFAGGSLGGMASGLL